MRKPETIERLYLDFNDFFPPRKINSWRELTATAAQARRYLDISPPSYEDAPNSLGQENSVTVIAGILQWGQHIQSAGGYLRVPTQKARGGNF